MIWFICTAYIAGGLFLLCKGADWLVAGASSLGLRLGLPPLAVGMVVVGFGTSSPEMAVSIGSVLQKQPDLAIGNILGSNIFNILLIGGVCALICPLKVSLQLIRLDTPLLIFISLLTWFMFQDGTATRMEGLVLITGLLLWTGWTFRSIGQEKEPELEPPVNLVRSNLIGDLSRILGGLAVLVAGSQLLVYGASDLARFFGVSESLIGFTVVAGGTSLPELASSVVAARRGQPDMALGNIIGSNIFNLLGILGITALVAPLSGSSVGNIEWIFFIGAAILVLPLMRSHFTVHRWEGALLCSGFFLYLILLWP